MTKDLSAEDKDDESLMYAVLLELYPYFSTPKAVAHFKSAEAQTNNSDTRKIVESARDWTGEMSEDHVAKVFFAALLLGGKTLRKLRFSIEYFERNRKKEICNRLRDLIMTHLHFHEDYASWLANSFHRLSDNSVDLLKDLNKDAFFAVRLSTVYHFDPKDKEKFKLRASVFSKGFVAEKRLILEDAISYTADAHVKLNDTQMMRVLTSTRNMDKLSLDEKK